MSSEMIARHEAGEIHNTAAVAMASGEIFQIADGRAAYRAGLGSVAVGDPATLVTAAVVDVLKDASTDFTAGAPVFWDASANLAVTAPTASDDFYLGACVENSANDATYVRVDLNVGVAGFGPAGQRFTFGSRVITIDHADTDEFTVLTAAQNPLGCYIVACVGEVTEQMGGSSQDQLVISIRDEDDNVIAVLTPSDGGADIVGDLIVATRTTTQGALGALIAKVPAGKSAHAVVTQATSGTGAAGAVKVHCDFRPAA